MRLVALAALAALLLAPPAAAYEPDTTPPRVTAFGASLWPQGGIAAVVTTEGGVGMKYTTTFATMEEDGLHATVVVAACTWSDYPMDPHVCPRYELAV